MTTINLIYVGNIRENYLLAAAAEYEKRLSAYCRLVCTELREEKLPDEPSQAQIDAAIKKKANGYSPFCRQKAKNRSLRRGKTNLFGRAFRNDKRRGKRRLFTAFVYNRRSVRAFAGSEKRMRFQAFTFKMTFTHRMARVLLLEQIYRAENIAAGGKYHK